MFDSNSLKETINNFGPINEYSFEIKDSKGQEGVSNVPVLMLVRFSKDIENQEDRETITLYSLLNRTVTIYCSRKKKIVKKVEDKDVIEYETLPPEFVTSIGINSVDTIWDSYEVFKDHPLALARLIDHCVGEQLKKLFPSPN